MVQYSAATSPWYTLPSPENCTALHYTSLHCELEPARAGSNCELRAGSARLGSELGAPSRLGSARLGAPSSELARLDSARSSELRASLARLGSEQEPDPEPRLSSARKKKIRLGIQ